MSDQETDFEPIAEDSEEDHLERISEFAALGLHDNVLRGVQDLGFEKCTPIQAVVLPQSLRGKDVVGKAQTGTGKTAAFLLTIFERFTREGLKASAGAPLALILAPTRELALQIAADGERLGQFTGFKIVAIVGGSDYDEQRKNLSNEPAIVVATPGRLIDLFKQRTLSFRSVKVAVIDEADRMFDLGFYPDIKYLMRKLPAFDRRQTLLFSATVSYRVTELSYEFMNAPVEVDVSTDQLMADNIEDSVYHLGNEEKLPFLLGYLKREAISRVIVFTNTKSAANWLCFKLRGNGFSTEVLTGDLTQAKRLSVVRGFKTGELQVLVATDIASRGLHVEEISHVVNFDVPEDAENYVHRVGRTARAGQSGKAVTFGCERYVESLPAVEALIGRKLPVCEVNPDDFLRDQAGPYRPVRSDRPPPRRNSSGNSYGNSSGQARRGPPSGGASRGNRSRPGRNRNRGGGRGNR